MGKLKRIIKSIFTFILTVIVTSFLLILPFGLLYFSGQLEQIVYLFFFALYYLLIGHFGIKAVVSVFKDISTKDSSKKQSEGLYTTIIANQALSVKNIVIYFKKLETMKIETNYDDLDLSMRKKVEQMILPNHQKKIISRRVMTVNDVLFGVNLSDSYIAIDKDGSKKIKLNFTHSIDFDQLFKNQNYVKGDDYKKDISSVTPELEHLSAKESEELEKLHQKKQEETFLSILEDSKPEIERIFVKQYFNGDNDLRFVEHFNHLKDRNIRLLSDYLNIHPTIENKVEDKAQSIKDWKGERSENAGSDLRSEAKAEALESPVRQQLPLLSE